MRQPRLLAPPSHPFGVYHCVSRVVDKRFIFGPAEKDHFLSLLRELEAFCQVDVLTYCLMSNHFHLLLSIPKRPSDPALLPSPEQLFAKLEALSGHQNVPALRQQFAQLRQAGDAAGEARLLARYHARLHNLSVFLQLLKQRFTHWFNVRADRRGTLWESRFRSVLVDGSGPPIAALAAYIDLNPVRAGLVQDPQDYRWCGYAEALAGRSRARLGLQRIVTCLQYGQEDSPSRSLEVYRLHLYGTGHEDRETRRPDGSPARGAFSHADALAVLQAGGKLPLSSYLRCRVRYLSDGFIYGSREFVEASFREFRQRFSPQRTSGARRCRGVESDLFTVRDLQKDVFG